MGTPAETKKWAMTEITLVIGATARCSDGFAGEVKSLVIDPGARVVTHLVVEPGVADEVRSGLARFVPLDHVDGSGEEGHDDHVHATDGDIGELWALRVDSSDGRVTQVLLEGGHLELEEVVIPIDHVAGFDDGIQLDIT